jgi:phospholipid/cholesterol/gamma-HCH transport system substrate-binding protein
LRTGIFGIVMVVCLVLVSFGYTTLPFWPQGRQYDAYFTNAAGIVPGNDVQIYGYSVGKVTHIELADRAAKVSFTVDRDLTIGDQSTVAIKADTVLGQKALDVAPAGFGRSTSIPLGRTTTPYSLSTALQDLGRNVGDLDKPRLTAALGVLTDTMRDATPQLRGALDGVTYLSKSFNAVDELVQQLLARAKTVSDVLARRSEQMNKLITDGNQLFAALSEKRQALGILISGIDDLARQLTGFVADNRKEFGPAVTKLNLVLDNLETRRAQIDDSLRRLPSFASQLGEVVGSAPGVSANVYGVPPPQITGMALDAYFQPGKLPDSLADFLRGFIVDRAVILPRSP